MKYLKTLACLTLLAALLPVVAHAQCGSVDFSADKTKSCLPGVIKFIATGAPAGSQYEWNVGNGFMQGVDTLQHLYTQPGNYDVSLRVTTPANQTCLVTKNSYIEIVANPTPTFSISRQLLCYGPDTVAFVNTTPNSETLDWIINGTIYSDGPDTIVHAFTTAGVKNVDLKVTVSPGCSGIGQIDSAVLVVNPIPVDFTTDVQDGCVPATVQANHDITDTASIVGFEWQFAGSSQAASNQKTPNPIIYIDTGAHVIGLKVTTDLGCQYSTQKPAVAFGETITPSFASNKQVICKSGFIGFMNQSGGQRPGIFTWSFPGGQQINGGAASPQVQYVTRGKHDVSLTYVHNGCVSTHLQSEYIEVVPPVAEFRSPNNIHCELPHTVDFRDSSDLPANGNSFFWTFYDTLDNVIGTSNLKDPSFTYTNYGYYDVQLVVSNANGCSDTIRKHHFVKLLNPKAEISVDTRTACLGQELNFSDVTDPFSYLEPWFDWSFYDLDGQAVIGKDSLKFPTFIYNDTGRYDVQLIIGNNVCRDTIKVEDFIHVTELTALIESYDSIGCEDELFTFVSNSEPEGVFKTYMWLFEQVDSANNNFFVTGNNRSINFPYPGAYHMTHVAFNNNLCTDTFYIDNAIKVSGIRAKVSADSLRGCIPFTTTFRSTIEVNEHFNNPSNQVSYQWSVSPSEGVTISNATAANTQITFTEKGRYSVSLITTNSEGCVNNVTMVQNIEVGTIAQFDMPDIICYGGSVFPVNNSDINPVQYQWTANRPGIQFLPNASAANPELMFSDTGSFDLKLEVTNSLGCKDEFTKNVIVNRIEASFTTSDTLTECAPALIVFETQALSADSFYWDFGDGTSLATTSPNVAHVYKRNSGGSQGQGFDVSLLVKSRYGCADSVFKPSHIKVVGPVPSFSLSNETGCAPLEVTFNDQSQNVSRFLLDYGDASVFDSISIDKHLYTIQDPTAQMQVYHPRLLAYDHEGCYAIYEPADSIVVFSQPVADFSSDITGGCAPLSVQFEDKSSGHASRQWDFNSDGIIDDTTATPVFVFSAGSYDVSLIVENANGCSDTIIVADHIKVNAAPLADFEVDKSTACYSEAVTFADRSVSAVNLTRWSWDFGDIVAHDTSDLQNPGSYVDTGVGSHDVTLTIWDEEGCSGSKTIPAMVLVHDSIPPAVIDVHVATVDNNSQVQVLWESSSDPLFEAYHIFGSTGSGFSKLTTATDRHDTSWFDAIAVEQVSGTYYVQQENTCQLQSTAGVQHTTILFLAEKNGVGEAKLSWSAYEGWGAVDGYEIYRSTNNGAFQKLADVDGTTTSYIDESLCSASYCYYVVANNNSTALQSFSNHSCVVPDFIGPTQAPEVVRSTVVDDKTVLTEWNNYSLFNKGSYSIDRFSESTGWQNGYALVQGDSFVDENVEVDEHSYTYRVTFVDSCGNVSPESNVGTSILLNVEVVNDQPRLRWNAYKGWAEGIAAYLVQIKGPDGFETLQQLAGNDEYYHDRELHEEITSLYCYRVVALRNNGLIDTSISNEVCVSLQSRIYVPTAFTPNDDGLNEVFIPSTSFIHNNGETFTYDFQIVDRWGEVIFRTNNPKQGWDGTYQDKPAPNGLYSFVIEAKGFDNKHWKEVGSVYLMR